MSFLNRMSEDDFSRHIQGAYLRGIDFAAELFDVDDEKYSTLWSEFVPKAVSDYTDKLVSGLTEKIESGANAAANSPAPEASAAATRTATTEIQND